MLLIFPSGTTRELLPGDTAIRWCSLAGRPGLEIDGVLYRADPQPMPYYAPWKGPAAIVTLTEIATVAN